MKLIWKLLAHLLSNLCRHFIECLSNLCRMSTFLRIFVESDRLCRIFGEPLSKMPHIYRMFVGPLKSSSNLTKLCRISRTFIEYVGSWSNTPNSCWLFVESLSNLSNLCRIFVGYVEYLSSLCRIFVEYVKSLSKRKQLLSTQSAHDIPCYKAPAGNPPPKRIGLYNKIMELHIESYRNLACGSYSGKYSGKCIPVFG